MPSARRPQRGPSGFTLIELIAAIGVVGVVGATAVPRLTALAGEARYASLQVAQGSLSSVAAIAHGQFAIRAGSTQTYGDVPLPMVNGYPGADAKLAEAAGLAPGYTVHARDAGTLVIVPKDLAGSAAADQCYLVYTESRTPQSAPAIALGTTASAAACS
jgi:MSHA pilin protein MshA